MNPVQALIPAVAGVSLFAPATLHATSSQTRTEQPVVQQENAVGADSAVSADDLLAEVRDCTPASHGNYRSDQDARATIPVCGTRDVVFWEADMDIDCDGQPGVRCNTRTDPHFSATTAFTQSDGRPLKSETLPFVVVPAPSTLWDYRAHGVRGGSVVAVVYRDRVQYAVVGDTGPAGIIGEASYATAEALGIDPDPQGGGTSSGVTYIVFRDSRVTPVEDRRAAVTTGEKLARQFVNGDQ
ncbi:glycoside hydrolase family 75 protein [Streptomyces sp. NWU339]|uniref:glycoside hydrolase family 75 protein n=1 Tax=Streptomyces sp. NWU339 TaxID=2185284 RepID=UPI00215A2B43|nr:glycoside hydrolase family 75 protein [Streptomyces sp. NWU339]